MSTAFTWYWLFRAPTVLSKTQMSERAAATIPFLLGHVKCMCGYHCNCLTTLKLSLRFPLFSLTKLRTVKMRNNQGLAL